MTIEAFICRCKSPKPTRIKGADICAICGLMVKPKGRL